MLGAGTCPGRGKQGVGMSCWTTLSISVPSALPQSHSACPHRHLHVAPHSCPPSPWGPTGTQRVESVEISETHQLG